MMREEFKIRDSFNFENVFDENVGDVLDHQPPPPPNERKTSLEITQ